MSKKLITGDLAEATGVLVASVAVRWDYAADAALEEIDMSPTQYILLLCLSALMKSDEPVKQAHLSRFTGIDAMLVSKHIRILEERGAVKRNLHPSDQRAVVLSITKSGASLLKQATRIIRKVDKEVFGNSANDKFNKQLIGAISWE